MVAEGQHMAEPLKEPHYGTCGPYNLCSIQCIGSPPSYHQTGLDFYLTIMSVLLPLLDITERLHVYLGYAVVQLRSTHTS